MLPFDPRQHFSKTFFWGVFAVFRERGTEYAFRPLSKQAFFYFFCEVTQKPDHTKFITTWQCMLWNFSFQHRKGGFLNGLIVAWTAFIQVPGVKSEENCGGKSAHTACVNSLFLWVMFPIVASLQWIEHPVGIARFHNHHPNPNRFPRDPHRRTIEPYDLCGRWFAPALGTPIRV